MDASDQLLDDYLDEWFALLRTRVQPTTWHGYQNTARAYLRPGLGQVRVGELTVRMLNLHYLRLLESDGRRGGPLSLRAVEYAHPVLHKALADGGGEGVLAVSVASRATVPRIAPGAVLPERKLRVWDAEQIEHFLGSAPATACAYCGGSRSRDAPRWAARAPLGGRRARGAGRVPMSLSVANGHPQL
jgi:hypothetical protein